MRNVVLLPKAEKEFLDTVSFYAQEFPEVGRAFSEEFFQSIEFIQHFPEAWEKVGLHTRKCILKRFPYLILYVVDKDQIIITAVAHQHRHPDSYLG